MLTVNSIFRRFGSVSAVNDLSFSVKQGEVLGLLGPNGAGKTTTMRIITGYLSADSGRVSVEGIDVAENPVAARLKMGYLPENNPLYLEMLTGEYLNYLLDLRLLDDKSREAGMDFAVRRTGIAEVFYQPIRELSKGYKQRVGIAASILHQPRVLIMDEPTEGLDPLQRQEIRGLIKELAKNHIILMSTHVMQEVEAVCSRIIIINQGKLVADASPRDLEGLAGSQRRILIEVEGKRVKETLEKLPVVRRIEVESKENLILRAFVVMKPKTFLQPYLSSAAAKNNWIIWKIDEEKPELENIFRQLTEKRHD